MVNVEWKGDMVFEATPPTGNKFVMDSHPESGGTNAGPTPVEALLGALAACSAIDVLSILHKKKQEVSSYRIEIEGERAPEGEWPRPFTNVVIRHIVKGPGLDEAAVERSVQLSDEKYCTVISTLRTGPEIRSEFIVESE